MTTDGRPNADAADAAKAAGVPVSTIAFGTASGTVVVQGQSIPVPVDATALQAVANTTGGKFFAAASAEQLQAAYADLGSSVGTTHEQREVTDWLVGAALAGGRPGRGRFAGLVLAPALTGSQPAGSSSRR